MQLERTLRTALFAGILVLPFIPLLVSGSMFFPYITGKNFAFRIVVEMLVGIWAVLALWKPDYRPSFSWILAALAAFVLSIGISDALGPNPFKSFWSNFERMEGWVTLVHLLGLSIVLMGMMKTRALWQRFLLVTVLASSFVALVGSVSKNQEVLILMAIALYGAGLAIMHVREEKLALQVFLGAFGAVLFTGLFAIGGWYGYFSNLANAPRISGTFGNPIYLAVYSAFHVFFCALLLAWYRPKGLMRYSLVGIMAMLVLAMLFTATRGTTLGLFGGAAVAGVSYLMMQFAARTRLMLGAILSAGFVGSALSVVALLFGAEGAQSLAAMVLKLSVVVLGAGLAATAVVALARHRSDRAAFSIAGALLGAVAFAGLFFAVKDMPALEQIPIVSRFATISLESGTAASRSMIWNMGIEGFKERPVFGWGQENFSFVFDKYYDPNMYAQEPWFDRVHNIVFDWLIQGGAVGAALYFSLPLLVLYYLWVYRRSDSPFSQVERAILTGAVVMYFFHNIFVFDNVISYIYYAVLLAYVHTRATDGAPVIAPDRAVSENTALTVAGPAAIVFTLALIYSVNAPGMATAQDLITALIPHNDGFATNYAAYERAYERRALGRQEVAEQLVQGAANVSRAQEAPAELKQQMAALADAAMQAELAKVPDSARMRLFYATYLAQTGKMEAAMTQIAEAERIAPTKQLVKFQKTEILLNQGKVQEAKEAMEQAYALAPAYADAAILLALTSLYAGDHARAKEVLLARFGTEAYDDERLVRAYVAQKIYPPVIEILKKRIEANPGEAQLRVSLSAAYHDAGQKEMAIQTLQEAIAAIPSFAPEGEKFIEQIRAGR